MPVGQRGVLNFLSTTPGVHKVSEIAVAVHGDDCDNAALQAVRRALTVLTGAGLAAKSTQSGTAFYSADAEAPAEAPATKAAAKKTPAKEATASKAAKTSKAARSAEAARPSKDASGASADAPLSKLTKAPATQARPAAGRPAGKAAATDALSAKTSKIIDDQSTMQVRKVTKKAGPTTAAAEAALAEKAVRADRTKIVAALLVASEPQPAGDVSRSVMGSQWKPSDATNFRNVLKSMLAEGVVAEHTDENSRARYTVAASTY